MGENYSWWTALLDTFGWKLTQPVPCLRKLILVAIVEWFGGKKWSQESKVSSSFPLHIALPALIYQIFMHFQSIYCFFNQFAIPVPISCCLNYCSFYDNIIWYGQPSDLSFFRMYLLFLTFFPPNSFELVWSHSRKNLAGIFIRISLTLLL